MSALIYVISVFYFLMTLVFTISFLSEKTFRSKKKGRDFDIFVSVIIPFRNEDENLPEIIQDILRQSFPTQSFEVIFVNDNSTDNSAEIVKNAEYESNIFLLENEATGKKAAIKTAIEKSRGKLIVTTDADCRLPKDWLWEIVNFYVQTGAKMIIAPVAYETTEKLFSFENFQALEFLSLQATTVATAFLRSPIMCNGANLAFERFVYQEFTDAMSDRYASGDDVFLMFNIKRKYRNTVRFLKSKSATVVTKPVANIKDFFNQRIRWASKVKHYTDFFTLIVGFITLMMNLFLFFGFCYGIVKIDFSYFFISFVFKFFVDFFLLLAVSSYFKQERLMWLYLPLQLVYFQYVVLVSVLSIFVKYVWKDRKIVL